jgi:peptide/nickel transport system permease protein
MNIVAAFHEPDTGFIMGADNFGRDVFSRTIHGGRISLTVGLGATLLGALLGVPLGLFSGYFGRWADALISRFLEIIMPFPSILIAIFITFAAGASQWTVILAIGIVLMPFFARLVRGNVYSIKQNQFVEAARGVGNSHLRIIFSHILPHCTAPVIIMASLCVAFSILAEASLSFLGLGVPPPTPTWGGDLQAGIKYLELAPWITLAPGLAIMVSVLGFNLFGDGLRDALHTEQSFMY